MALQRFELVTQGTDFMQEAHDFWDQQVKALAFGLRASAVSSGAG